MVGIRNWLYQQKAFWCSDFGMDHVFWSPTAYDVVAPSKHSTGKNWNFISYKKSRGWRNARKRRGDFLIRMKEKNIMTVFRKCLAEDQPYTFLYVPEALVIISKRFRGVEPAPILAWNTNFIKWYVSKDEQKYKNDQIKVFRLFLYNHKNDMIWKKPFRIIC